MKITYFLRDDGASGYYRVDMPIRTMVMNSDDVQCAAFRHGDDFGKLNDVLTGADVIVIPRMNEPEFIKLAKEMQKEGKKVVLDHDDNMFKISPLSNHYETCGTEEVEVIMRDGQKVKLWEDGKNINLKKNRTMIDNFKRACGIVDCITVTTDILADVYHQFNDNVQVLPNCIDLNLWKRLPFKNTEEIRFGWFGGSSHFEDLAMIQDTLADVIELYPQAKLVIFGQPFPSLFKKIPEDRIEVHPWVKLPAYPYKAAILNLDFAIIPLVDNEFNRCKSAIKWVEMGALSVPSISSFISPYKEVCCNDNGIFIADNGPPVWFDGIKQMIEDPILRSSIGGRAYDTVIDSFDINKQWPLWKAAYGGLL